MLYNIGTYREHVVKHTKLLKPFMLFFYLQEQICNMNCEVLWSKFRIRYIRNYKISHSVLKCSSDPKIKLIMLIILCIIKNNEVYSVTLLLWRWKVHLIWVYWGLSLASSCISTTRKLMHGLQTQHFLAPQYFGTAPLFWDAFGESINYY